MAVPDVQNPFLQEKRFPFWAAGLRNFRPPICSTHGAAARYRRPKPAGQERAGAMDSSHNYEVAVMYGAVIESAS